MFVPGRRRGAFERLSQKTCLCITHKKASPDLGGCSFNHSRNLWNLLLYPSGYSFFVAEFTCPSYFVLLHTGHGTLLQVSRHFGAIGWKKRAHNIVGNIMCSSSRNKRSTWPEPDAGVGHVLFIIPQRSAKRRLSGSRNSVWKIFLFTPCILSGKLYNELKRKPFVKYKFYKR